MHLIIGGAYQGKTDYAVRELGVRQVDVFNCELLNAVDWNAPCIVHLERFVLQCLRKDLDPMAELEQQNLQDKVLICEDMSCGLVPMEEEMRAWRELTGRTLCQLSRKADHVTRIFCGLPQKLK